MVVFMDTTRCPQCNKRMKVEPLTVEPASDASSAIRLTLSKLTP
jgi:hypothetical protein